MEQHRALGPRLGGQPREGSVVAACVIARRHRLAKVRVDARGRDIVETESALAPLPAGRVAAQGSAEALRIGGKARRPRACREVLEASAQAIGRTRRQALVLGDHCPGAVVGPGVEFDPLAGIVARIEVGSGSDQRGDDGGLGGLAQVEEHTRPGGGAAQIGIGTRREQQGGRHLGGPEPRAGRDHRKRAGKIARADRPVEVSGRWRGVAPRQIADAPTTGAVSGDLIGHGPQGADLQETPRAPGHSGLGARPQPRLFHPERKPSCP
ncbi:hypothetical protein [Porphyrobacter sp. AAP82]|uniref:hypothetical protein n=1 Tax=Porphyrobacter sp. AAP82 TaxID=1248917 RepID=UPI00036238DD|nr:hypothetical protein [Porphyrobacter sp. AAP82]